MIDKLAKSLKVLAFPRGFDRRAWHETDAGPLFDGDNLLGRAPALQKIAQGETKVLAEETRDTGATQVCIDENDPIAGQRGCPSKCKSMGGFSLASGRRA